MSPLTARSVSMALLGGIATVLLYSQGLLVWAGFVAWAAFLEAGGDTAALKTTIAGNLFGACVAWVALTVTLHIPVPSEGAAWILRAGALVAVTLPLLVMGTRIALFSRASTNLLGYAAMFGAVAIAIPVVTILDRLQSFHLYNPLIVVALSMITGAVFGLLSNKLTEALTKK